MAYRKILKMVLPPGKNDRQGNQQFYNELVEKQ